LKNLGELTGHVLVYKIKITKADLFIINNSKGVLKSGETILINIIIESTKEVDEKILV
jgi:hypothetical protein